MKIKRDIGSNVELFLYHIAAGIGSTLDVIWAVNELAKRKSVMLVALAHEDILRRIHRALRICNYHAIKWFDEAAKAIETLESIGELCSNDPAAKEIAEGARVAYRKWLEWTDRESEDAEPLEDKEQEEEEG